MFGGMGNMGNMAGMMKKVQKMQNEMKKMQDELKRKTVDVTAGGGAVKIVMNGEKQVQSLTIGCCRPGRRRDAAGSHLGCLQ